MRASSVLALASAAGLVDAQRPTNTSICDYYTTALLKENTAANQYTLLTLVVNTAVIGNYTTPNVGITVPGILAKGTFNGTAVNLLPYFDGSLLSSNRGNSSGVSLNFLDDGGAAPLKENKPCNGTQGSRQCQLLIHLYEYFGGLLGCSLQGQTGFPAYAGQTSQYRVHKFMDLNPYQVGYFIQQVGLSAASFGVATADVQAVGTALDSLFNYRCEAPIRIPVTAQPELQSICIDGSCPIAANATCPLYDPVTAPAFTNGTVYLAPGSAFAKNGGNSTSRTNGTSGTNGTSSGNGTRGGSGTVQSNGASALASSAAIALVLGFGAMLL